MNKTIFFVFLLLSVHVFGEPRVRPNSWAPPVIGTELENVYRVDDGVFRSEQPSADSFKLLLKLGVTEVLNLREYHDDNDEAKGSGLVLHRIKMDTGEVTQQQLIDSLALIKKRNGPILVHCWHGADRTGVTIAAYRIVFNGWSKSEAIDEMVNGGYGHHGSVYPNLVELIKNLDIKTVKTKLGLRP